MAIFDWLFGKRRDDGGSTPLRLRLKHPPTPEHAAKLAQISVDTARHVDNVHLDYTPASLAEVDKILGRFHAEGLRAGEIGETVFSFGCYAGEVMARNLGGVWKMPSDCGVHEPLKLGFSFMVSQLPNGAICNPIGKAFKLLEQGEGESLAYFYQVFSNK